MELSLHLCFYIRCSLRGYPVGTTTGFLVEIVEVLAHHLLTKYHGSAHSDI
jgi:hypothetical protein